MEQFLNILQNADAALGILTAFFAGLIWLGQISDRRELARRRNMANQLIEVVLTCGGQNAVMPLHLRRADVTRAEVLGRMGMIPMREKGKRFTLAFLATPAFLQGVNEVADGKTSLLVIPCSEEEFLQFAL